MDEETCLKPIGEIAQAIENTSAFDLLLFMVVQAKAQKVVDETAKPC